MSQSATPAMQNDMTTCLETFEKEMFCSFPHRHGDATGKPETRDETRGCKKTSISCETSSNFDIFDTLSNRLECHKVPRLPCKTTWQPAWKPSKRRCFAASPIDTATPQENQRLETRQVGAPKRAFRARLPPIFTLCSFKIDVFLRVFLKTWKKLLPQNQCFVRRFRQFSAHVTKCHACHEICTLSPLDAALPMRFAINTQQDTSKVLRLPRKMTMDTSKVLRLPRKMQHIFWKRRKSIAPATQNDFRHVTKHVWMSRSATPATRNEATTHWKLPKMTTSAELPRHGHTEFVRTVADGCGRLRPQTQRRANTTSTPRPPEWNGNPCYAFGKKRQ